MSLCFDKVSLDEFLKSYWQKKPLVIRSAIPNFELPLTADELAGLSLEEEIESRLVFETPNQSPGWRLQRGPFNEEVFAKLPATHWTLLVQGVDRFVPEVALLLEHFDFLPSWRVDDIMISYAVKHGSVGPHYDNYDVFLYQAKGQRKWLLTTTDCIPDNYQTDVELRIMKQFNVEQEIILEEGDMLYLPPHVGHHGISLSDDCMTYSFGYRSYQGAELWDSFGEYLATSNPTPLLYQDPSWSTLAHTAEIPKEAWQKAKETLLKMLDDETVLKNWFAAFATSLDNHAEQILPVIEEDDEDLSFDAFGAELMTSVELTHNPVCRFAYVRQEETPFLKLFINGCAWETEGVSPDLLMQVANHRCIQLADLSALLTSKPNLSFLYELWKLQWIILC